MMRPLEVSGSDFGDDAAPTDTAGGWGTVRPRLLSACLLSAIVGILLVYGWTLRTDYRNTRENAERSGLNIVEATATAIRRDFETISLSIDGTINALQQPGV